MSDRREKEIDDIVNSNNLDGLNKTMNFHIDLFYAYNDFHNDTKHFKTIRSKKTHDTITKNRKLKLVPFESDSLINISEYLFMDLFEYNGKKIEFEFDIMELNNTIFAKNLLLFDSIWLVQHMLILNFKFRLHGEYCVEFDSEKYLDILKIILKYWKTSNDIGQILHEMIQMLSDIHLVSISSLRNKDIIAWDSLCNLILSNNPKKFYVSHNKINKYVGDNIHLTRIFKILIKTQFEDEQLNFMSLPPLIPKLLTNFVRNRIGNVPQQYTPVEMHYTKF